jgi:hypothetical protein
VEIILLVEDRKACLRYRKQKVNAVMDSETEFIND